MDVKYVADDGIEFDTENECLEYEHKFYDFAEISCYDRCLRPVGKEGDIWGRDIWFVKLKTEKEVELFEEVNKEYLGVTTEGIEGVGKYFYDDQYDRWFTIESFTEFIRNIHIQYNQALKLFGGN